jgi:choline transport protein
LHVVGFVVIIAVLGAMSEKHSASYVFTELSNTSGWENDGVSWLVGLLSTVYPFLGYDRSKRFVANERLTIPPFQI